MAVPRAVDAAAMVTRFIHTANSWHSNAARRGLREHDSHELFSLSDLSVTAVRPFWSTMRISVTSSVDSIRWVPDNLNPRSTMGVRVAIVFLFLWAATTFPRPLSSLHEGPLLCVTCI
jgi:hypothetical protein